MLPSGLVGVALSDVVVYLDDLPADQTGKYRCSGNLDGWSEIPRLAEGNSRVMMALALAFVGPVAPLMGARNVAIQLVGEFWLREDFCNVRCRLGLGLSS